MSTIQPDALQLAEQYDHGDPAAHGNAWKAAMCNEVRRLHNENADLRAELASIGAGGVSALMGAANAGSEPVAWPKDATEVRELFRSDFIRAEYVADDHQPCDEDRYYISAHDFLSAINWWADFPHHPSPPEGAGWRPASEAPQGQLMLFCDMNASELRASFFVDWVVDGVFCGNRHHQATHCRPLPPAPPASEAKGA